MEFGILKPLAYSLALSVIASIWTFKYGAARKDRKYSEGRQAVFKDERFRHSGKVIFVLGNVITCASFWTDSKLLLSLYQEDGSRVAGIIVLSGATLLHLTSMRFLGDNYSPFFDSHLPFMIVTQGPYRYIRHPVYLANILLSAGYSIASGSLWVLALGGYGAFKVLKALVKEELYLSQTFPGYKTYQAKTARLIPFIY